MKTIGIAGDRQEGRVVDYVEGEALAQKTVRYFADFFIIANFN